MNPPAQVSRSDQPVGFQNSATGIDLGFYVARSYSLMKPPRTGRRLIRSWERSATGSRAGAGARWTPRSRLASPAHAAVVELAAAWRDPAAGEGMTEAGGLRMPAGRDGCGGPGPAGAAWLGPRRRDQPIVYLRPGQHGSRPCFHRRVRAAARDGLFGPVADDPRTRRRSTGRSDKPAETRVDA